MKNKKEFMEFTYKEVVEYDLIKLHQIESSLSENNKLVFAINPFPLFLLEIGGSKQFQEFKVNLKDIGCECDYSYCSKLFGIL
jgi:hypothetical protein